MFIREKQNKSGVISVQIINKSSGKYKLDKTIGSSADKKEIDRLYKEGQEWIKNKLGQIEIDFMNERQLSTVFLTASSKLM